jgi:small subunit ribosomal protein S19
MAIDEFKFYGKTEAELKALSIEDFIKLVPARRRRTLKRGVIERHKPLLEKIKLAKEGKRKKPIKTHSRDMLVVPDMLGMTIHVHTGRQFNPIIIQPEMLGHFLGEFALTRNRVAHSAPGVGATKSSTAAASKAK